MHLTIFTESGILSNCPVKEDVLSVWLVNKYRSLRLWLAHLSHELIGKDKQNLTNVLPDSQWMYSVRLQKMYIFAHKEMRKDISSTVVFRPTPWWITTIILTSAESTFLFGIYDHVSWNLLCETHYRISLRHHGAFSVLFWQALCPTPRLELYNLPSQDIDGSWCIDPPHPTHTFHRKQCDSLPASRCDPLRATDLRICGLVL